MWNNPMQMMQEFYRFRQTFKGNPQQEVMKMLQNGQISQKQLNEIQNMAVQFQNMLRSIK